VSESKEKAVQRVSLDDLVIDDEDGRYLYGDKPFTGIAYLASPSGSVREEVRFVEGRKEGFVKTWFPGGQQASEESVLGGRRHGRTREWHPNGELKHDGMYEFGICTRATEWDDTGRVVRVYNLEPSSANYEALARLRSIDWADPAVQRLLEAGQSERPAAGAEGEAK
jgi:antitoxin component YwqK of YwqJK toxin-antitoxin module